MTGTKSLAMAGLMLAMLLSPSLAYPRYYYEPEQRMNEQETTMMDFNRLLNQYKNWQDTNVRDQGEQEIAEVTTQCDSRLYVMAITSTITNADTVDLPFINIKLTSNEVVSLKLYGISTHKGEGDFWEFKLSGQECITESNIDKVIIKEDGDDGWNIESIVTMLRTTTTLHYLTTDLNVNRWIDGDNDEDRKTFVLTRA